jgi:hypothetical protein
VSDAGMSDVIDDLVEWAAQEDVGVTDAGQHILSRASAEILLLRSQVAALKTMVRVNAYRAGISTEDVDAALAQFKEHPDANS